MISAPEIEQKSVQRYDKSKLTWNEELNLDTENTLLKRGKSRVRCDTIISSTFKPESQSVLSKIEKKTP